VRLNRGTVAFCVVLLVVAGSIEACSRPRATSSGCPGVGRFGGSRGSEKPSPATVGRPPPVPEALWVVDPSGVVRAFDGRTNRVSATVSTGHMTPVAPELAVGGSLLWVYQFDEGVTVVDTGSARVIHHATVPAAHPLSRNRLYPAFGGLWIGQPGQLWRVSPAAPAFRAALPDGFAPTGLAATNQWLWLAEGRRLLRINPVTGVVTATVDRAVPDDIGQLLGTPRALYAVGRSEIWVLDPDSGASRSVVHVAGTELVTRLYAADTAVWATGNCGDVMRVGVPVSAPPQVRTVRISDVSQDLPAAVALKSLWVADEVRAEVVRVDAGTGQVLARIPVDAADPDDPGFAVVAGQQSVWVVDTTVADRLYRVDPATNRLWRLPSATAPSGTGPAGSPVPLRSTFGFVVAPAPR